MSAAEVYTAAEHMTTESSKSNSHSNACGLNRTPTNNTGGVEI